MKGIKHMVTLDDGHEVSGREDWTTKESTLLFTEWSAGTSPHFGISQARALAMVLKYPELKIGEFQGIPVLDTEAVLDKILSSADKDMDIQVTKIATSRATGAAKLAKAKEALTKIPGLSQEQLDAIRKLL